MAGSTVVQDISEQVTCGICLEHFKIPKTVIPCLHNFCEVCLQNMIESTAQPKLGSLSDPRVFTMYTFPCPSCRGSVEFPVRIPRPWNMNQIARYAVKEEFKTNFQIENQLEIINQKIEKGCPQHQGEVRMWFCKVCHQIICQFCVQEDHNPPDHEITLLNVVARERRKELSKSKEAVEKNVDELEATCAVMQSQLETIHSAKSKYEDQKRVVAVEFLIVHNELDSLEEGLLRRGHNFNEQLKSKEMEILEVYQEESDTIDSCKTQIEELTEKLFDTDLDLVEMATDSMPVEYAEYSMHNPICIPNLEIAEPPEVSLDLLQQGMLEIKSILSSIARDFELSWISSANSGSDGNQHTSPIDPSGGARIKAEGRKVAVCAENNDQWHNERAYEKRIRELTWWKYTYAKDQWSPLNPEGKRKYSRDFLLQFQPECLVKPVGLPNIPGVVLDKHTLPIDPSCGARIKDERRKVDVCAENNDQWNNKSANNRIRELTWRKYTYAKDLKKRPEVLETVTYKNQWSPLNPEGKRKYSRDFLLQFQPECLVKPVGLPNIPGVVLDKHTLPIDPSCGARIKDERRKVYVCAENNDQWNNKSANKKRIRELTWRKYTYAKGFIISNLVSDYNCMAIQHYPTDLKKRPEVLETVTYKNQWSPLNPEGKRKYSRDFLLQFQPECLVKPVGLPNIPGVVLDKHTLPIDPSCGARIKDERRKVDVCAENNDQWNNKSANKKRIRELTWRKYTYAKGFIISNLVSDYNCMAIQHYPTDLKKRTEVLETVTYKNQWSPLNPEGKRKYSRDFLLQFQPECLIKPAGLPNIPGVVLDKHTLPIDPSGGARIKDERRKVGVYDENNDQLNQAQESAFRKRIQELTRRKYIGTYAKDQWSPLNPEGKRKYSRDFLLQFQPECLVKPVGLPNIPGVVLDKADIRPISAIVDPRLASKHRIREDGGRKHKADGILMPKCMRSPKHNNLGLSLDQFLQPSQLQPANRKKSKDIAVRESKGTGAEGTSEKAKEELGVTEEREKEMEPLTRDMLAYATRDEQTQMFGERLYPIILQINKSLAGKITGVLLAETDNDELLYMLESRDYLATKAAEVIDMLKSFNYH